MQNLDAGQAALRAGEDQMMWWQPWGLSPRISAQRAVVVLSRIVDELWGSVRFGGRSLGPGRGAVPGAAIMLIRPELKRALGLSLQAVAGLGEGVLFPDFDGFAQAHTSSIEFADPGVYALRANA